MDFAKKRGYIKSTVIRYDAETKTICLAVRDLLREGRGYGRFSPGPPHGMSSLGQKAHSDVQARKIASSRHYGKEHVLRWETKHNGYCFVMEGRVDLVHLRGKRVRVEEIKSVALPSTHFRQFDPHDFPEFIWQARLYTYIFSLIQPEFDYRTRLIIVNLLSAKTRQCEVTFDPDECAGYIRGSFQEIIHTIEAQEKRQARQREWSKTITFPFSAKRPGQDMMIDEVAATLENGIDLLMCAPTGTGKTLGVLYPAVKFALKHGKRIFYLTSKTTQRMIVRETVGQFHQKEISIKSVFLSASEKMCPNEIHFCHESVCKFAAQHRENMDKISIHTLFEDPLLTSDKIFRAGVQAGVCPFELSLTLAMAADLIVCDFNYVFDPLVSLQRFFANKDYSDIILIIDEAHNLYDRGRESFSAQIGHKDLQKVIDHLKDKKTQIHKNLRSFCRRVQKVFQEYHHIGEIEHGERSVYECQLNPDEWQQFSLELEQIYLEYILHLIRRGSIRPDDPVNSLYNAIRAFSLIGSMTGSEFRFLYDAHHDGILKIICCDPSRLLARRLRGFHASIAMSATLEPLEYFRDVLGFSRHASKLLSVPSPFPPENRLFLVADNISTRYKDRMAGYQRIGELISRVVSIRPGNYLVFFPSFNYLQAVRLFLPKKGFDIIVQRSGMEESERNEVIERMTSSSKDILLLAVSGGIFSEGIDFRGEMAVGAFVVSPSLPKISVEQEVLRTYYDDRNGKGFEYAYVYPGMQKVIQAAGRVIRTTTDNGIIVLVGERFAEAYYQRLFPEHWYDRNIKDMVPENPLEKIRLFWEHHEKQEPL